TKADDTSYFGTPVDNSGELRYSFKEVTNIKLNGVDGGTGFCVDSFNIQFDNNLQTQRCIGTGSAFAGANIPTTFTPSGSVTLSWSKAAWDLYQKTFTGELFPFEFTVSNAEGSYRFYLPKVQVVADWPDGGNTDIIQVQLDITAADESPTITRTPAGS
ncbi:TPA: Ig domain-containing protein, partial [Citrobacter koseri]|nr:Ig domain-containing protein [Citrobacter koseri]